MRNTIFWLIEYIIAGLDFFMNVWILKMLLYYYKEKLVRMCIIQCAVSLFCTDSHGELDSVCEHVWKRETRNVSWLSACDIQHCVSPLPTFPHTYTQAAAPLVIHHLSEKIEEGLLWSFLMEKKASKPPSPPTTPVFTQTESWRILSLLFFSFHLAPSFVFLLPFSLCFHVLLTKGWLECFLSSSH